MEKLIVIDDFNIVQIVFGVADKNVRLFEKELKVKISLNPEGVVIKGKKEAVEKSLPILKKVIALAQQGIVLGPKELQTVFDAEAGQADFRPGHQDKEKDTAKGISPYTIQVASGRKKYVLAKTKGQQHYIDAIRKYDIVFSLGPAGTGKTYLAMAEAVNALITNRVRRIILTRPAIEAGESLGFLPGGISDKLGPYLRPLYDALYDMMDAPLIEKYLESGSIEIVPLAYMRGRTLNNAFVILDEAQNCTAEQLKMFLTRLGFDSKTIITADGTQSDLPGGKPIGLLEALRILKEVKGIEFVNLTKKDVVRHPLIQKIIQAYEDFYSDQTR